MNIRKKNVREKERERGECWEEEKRKVNGGKRERKANIIKRVKNVGKKVKFDKN